MKHIWIVAAALLPMTAQAQTMHFVANGGTAPNRHTDWIDSDSRVRNGDIVTFWVESLLETTRDDGVNRTMTFYRGDCAATRIGVIQTMMLFADGRPSRTSAGDMNVALTAPTPATRPLLGRACSTAPFGSSELNRRPASEEMWRGAR